MNNNMISISNEDAYEYSANIFVLFKSLLELTDLLRLESELKKRHRAYLHVREDIDEKVKEARLVMLKVSKDMIELINKTEGGVCESCGCRDCDEDCLSCEDAPCFDGGGTDDGETVTIAKEDYETMIDDLLTMSEIIQCVADMRTQDVKAIREIEKFVPAFASFEKNRLSLYREAAKEAEDIFDRWADEFDDLDEDFMEDEDYEPDEYYSD